MIAAVKAWFVRELDFSGSARACAVLRILVMLALCFKALVYAHPVRLDDPVQRLAGAALLVSAPLALVGYKTRLTSLIVALSWGYLHVRWGLVDHEFFSHGIQESQSTIWVAVLPSGKSMSVDRWLAVRRARDRGEAIPSEVAPLWGVWVTAIGMSCLYFWAGLDKVDADWFGGQRIDKLLLHNWGSSDSFGRYPTVVRVASVGMAVGATILELGLSVGLLIPRLRKYMIFPGFALHLGIWLMLGVWPFTMLCLASYIVLIPPQLVHDWFETTFDRSSEGQTATAPKPGRGPRWWVVSTVTLAFTAWCWQGPMRESKPAPGHARGEPATATWHWSLLRPDPARVCDLRYYERVDGQDRYIDRLETMGFPRTQLRKSRRVRGVTRGMVRKRTRELCEAMLQARDGEALDVRAQIRCPSREGWDEIEDGSRNVCEGVRRPSKKKKKKATKPKPATTPAAKPGATSETP